MFLTWFRRDDFYAGESVIMDSYFSKKQQYEVKNVLVMDLFLTNMQLFA